MRSSRSASPSTRGGSDPTGGTHLTRLRGEGAATLPTVGGDATSAVRVRRNDGARRLRERGPSGSCAAPPVLPSRSEAPPDFFDLARASRTASFTASYRVTVSESGETFAGDQFWFVKPPRARFDIDLRGRSSIYVLESGTYVCVTVPRPACVAVPRDAALERQRGAQLEEQVKDEPDRFSTTYEGPKKIIGYETHCYIVRPRGDSKGGFLDSRMCYTPGGIPLSVYVRAADGEMTLQALGVSTSVSDSQFILPAKPTRL